MCIRDRLHPDWRAGEAHQAERCGYGTEQDVYKRQAEFKAKALDNEGTKIIMTESLPGEEE